jgi:hypothetical protein
MGFSPRFLRVANPCTNARNRVVTGGWGRWRTGRDSGVRGPVISGHLGGEGGPASRSAKNPEAKIQKLGLLEIAKVDFKYWDSRESLQRFQILGIGIRVYGTLTSTFSNIPIPVQAFRHTPTPPTPHGSTHAHGTPYTRRYASVHACYHPCLWHTRTTFSNIRGTPTLL